MGNACIGALEALCCKYSVFGLFWQIWCLRGVVAVYRLVSVRMVLVCLWRVFL